MARWQVALVPLLLLGLPGRPDDPDVGSAIESITEDDVGAHLLQLASPELEGRDTPSEGQERAAGYIAERFAEAGFVGLAKPRTGAVEATSSTHDTFLLPYVREYQVPDERACELSFTPDGGSAERLVLEKDWVPLRGCPGSAEGPPVFLGFGISARKEHYDDLRGTKLEGRIAVVLEGEPRHKRVLDGPDVTDYADVYNKVDELQDRGVSGVLVVRRPPEPTSKKGSGLPPPAIGYRYSWAYWNLPTENRGRGRNARAFDIPVAEITVAAARRILGVDVEAIGEEIDRSGKPQKHEPDGVTVSFATAFETKGVQLFNVAGVLRGTDPELAGEYLVLGAHYDHIGVDPRGRIGYGADDNASGTSGLIELAQAFGLSPARRSIVVAAFSGEEDGLLGSEAFAEDPPVPRESIVAMLNMDMIGRGSASEVIVIGTRQNPEFEDVLKEAKKLSDSGIKKVVTGKGEEFWERSDQFSFHQVGIPVLFFFEAEKESDNPDYHTFRDTIELLDLAKITRTARFVFNTAWLIANDDDRPPPPR